MDDEKVVRSSLTKELMSHGYAVESAATGEEALTLVEENEYHLIYMDMCLPGMDGVETCRQIRKIKPNSNLVCFTGVIDNSLLDKESEFQDVQTPVQFHQFPLRYLKEVLQLQ